MWFEGVAWAQNAAAASAGPPAWVQMLPLFGVMAILYFVLVRPQMQRGRDQEKMRQGLKRNDEVVTSGGLLGRIVDLGDKVVGLEIAQGVKVRIERAQIASISAYGKTPKGQSGKEE